MFFILIHRSLFLSPVLEIKVELALCGSKLAELTLIRSCKPRAGGDERIGDEMVKSRPIEGF